MRKLCPTCEWLNFDDRSVGACILHSNPDPIKYYCLSTADVSEEEKIEFDGRQLERFGECEHGLKYTSKCDLCKNNIGKDDLVKCRTCDKMIDNSFAFMTKQYEHAIHLKIESLRDNT